MPLAELPGCRVYATLQAMLSLRCRRTSLYRFSRKVLALTCLAPESDGGASQVMTYFLSTSAAAAHHVFADRAGLPGKVGARGVYLIELRSVVIAPCQHEGHPKWPHPARFCRQILSFRCGSWVRLEGIIVGVQEGRTGELLHGGCYLSTELCNRYVLLVHPVVGLHRHSRSAPPVGSTAAVQGLQADLHVCHLRLLASFPNQHRGVWAHAAVGDANIGREQGDLLHCVLLY